MVLHISIILNSDKFTDVNIYVCISVCVCVCVCVCSLCHLSGSEPFLMHGPIKQQWVSEAVLPHLFRIMP